jgi:probable rRNA maturation factor
MAPPRPKLRRVWSATRRHPRLRYSRAQLGRCLAVLDGQPGCHPPDGEISLVFLTDDALARLHADFLGDPSKTDVITFPGDVTEALAGEICISVDRAMAEAKKRFKPFASELTLYLVHGWLHLAGLDDLTPKGRREMRQGERRLLQALKQARALPDFHLNAPAKRRV